MGDLTLHELGSWGGWTQGNQLRGAVFSAGDQDSSNIDGEGAMESFM